jgi:amino acid transporter
VRLLSAVVIALLTAVNCYNVRWGARLQGCFMVTKLLALAIVVVVGIVYLAQGNTENIQEPFAGTNLDPGKISLAFYSGLFSFAGWNYLNFVTEELREPYKNLPRAIWLSMPLVTLVYALANLSYFIVLSKSEILSSNAVAVTFADKIGVVIGYMMPFFVASSAFGALNGNIFAPSRLVFVGARQGHLPAGLAIINVDTYTPIPALVFLGVISIGMLVVEDVYTLINYMSFIEALAFTGSVAGVLILRWKKPDLPRPIKVNIILPIIFLAVCMFLLVVPVVMNPASELGVSLSVVCSGIPVYFICIYWKSKPQWMRRLGNLGAQKSIIANPAAIEEIEPLLRSSVSNGSKSHPPFVDPIPTVVMTQGEMKEADYANSEEAIVTPGTNVTAAGDKL